MPFRSATIILAALVAVLASTRARAAEPPGRERGAGNPLLPGYFADPSIVQHEGTFFLYATLDPWGGDTLGCWESPDFKDWTYRVLNWPTKTACKSPTSGGAAVWAPSVVRGHDGRFHMFVSVGNEVWTGVAEHPLGPWRDANGGKPLVPHEFRPGFHMIDAEAFIDDDGTAWLYWGSGWDWKNGKCWAVKLKPDMVSFDGEVRDVTPANYFEAPVMVKRNDRYFLMYSNGITVKDTYQVHYAVGDNPLGPFTEAPNSPILVTSKENNIISPGHHTVFRFEDRDYILYHRHSIPFKPESVGRQICVDELRFTDDGLIGKVVPTHAAPALARRRTADDFPTAKASASAEAGPEFAARFAVDDNHATRWSLPAGEQEGWLQLDLGAVVNVSSQDLLFEFAWREYRFHLQASNDGTEWRTLLDARRQPVAGSPIRVMQPIETRFLRLSFPSNVGHPPSLFEWRVRR